MENRFELQWPRDNLFFSGYVHDILSYRYHWHESDYELCILLKGRVEYCRDGQLCEMGEDDIIIANPGVGHATFALEPALAVVIHFSALALKPYLKPGQMFRFDFLTDASNRSQPVCRQIRFFSAQLLQTLYEDGPYSRLTAKASLEMLISVLCRMCSPQVTESPQTDNEIHQQTLKNILKYVSENYAGKITLETLSGFSQYNRTYISTFFKKSMGMNFYEYLTRIRFQHAVFDLISTNKSLTDVALDNGFPDLKSFNQRFKATFQLSPAEYRPKITSSLKPDSLNHQNFYDMSHPDVKRKLEQYLLFH